jgi:hypothetical protein
LINYNLGKLKKILVILTLVILSTYTHLWNLTGFPLIHIDEGHYLSKAISTLEGKGLQPQNRYYAPYFGQMFLSGIFEIIGYPSVLLNINASESPDTVADLYLVPRLIMGILGVVDTLLILRIAEKRYGQTVGFISAVLFAVMPLSWLPRWILLESIQLPFLLTSILLIVNTDSKRKEKLSIIISGLFMGLAIFTKIPAFTFMPLGGFIIYSNTGRLKYLVLWLIPAILIPALWPIHATVTGNLNEWISGIVYQTHRNPQPFMSALYDFFLIDPVLFILGIAGLVFGAIKRDTFLVLLIGPAIVFFYLIGYVNSFHLILLIPSLCIAGGYLLDWIGQILTGKLKVKIGQFVPIAGVALFGLLMTSQLISLDLNSSYYNTISFLLTQLPNKTPSSSLNEEDIRTIDMINSNQNRPSVVSSAGYFWIPELVFNKNFYAHSYYSHNTIKSNRFIIISDEGFLSMLNRKSAQAEVLSAAYNSTHSLARFNLKSLEQIRLDSYPYNSLNLKPLSKIIDIRANY